MTNNDLLLDIQRLERQSRRSLPFVGIALILVVVAVLYSAVALARLQRELTATDKALQAKKAELVRTQHFLLEERSRLAFQNSRLRDENNALLQNLHASTAPLREVVKPLLTAYPLKGIKDDAGNQLYDFTLSLYVPPGRANEVRRVNYIIHHPLRLEEDVSSDNAAAAFARSYRGNGCFNPVFVKVTPASAAPFTIPFDMCAEWQRQLSSQLNATH